jgi:hypothetical protein
MYLIRASEAVAVYQFCELADELGLEIRDAENIPRTIEETLDVVIHGEARQRTNFHRDYGWAHVPFTFAQHHGIPTSYLDWTREPLVAAFFAADWEDHLKSPDDICVWAATCLGVCTGSTEWITAPRRAHRYLHAQHGVFSYDTRANDFFLKEGKWPSYQEGDLRGPRQPEPLLEKLVLPKGEILRLQKLLFQRRISRAHLMPVLDNVAKSIIKRWEWY